MQKAYIITAVLVGLIVFLILIKVLIPWWLALALVLGAAWLFRVEALPLLHLLRPQRRGGWQRNALRWKRREWPDKE
jgi:hypothetical protein